MNQPIKSYFFYSKNEKRGLLLLLILLLIMIIYWTSVAKATAIEQTIIDPKVTEMLCIIENNKTIAAQQKIYRAKLRQQEYENKYKNKWPKKKAQRQSHKRVTNKPLTISTKFDPNVVTDSLLTQLGLPPKAISTWLKFTAKGGTFRSPKDLSKLYNLSSAHYEQVYPFIDIPEKEKEKSQPTYADNKKEKNDHKTKAGIISLIDLNTATADDLLPIYGIGQATSRRIIEYRDNLGGFSDINQVAKIWGIADSTYQQIAQSVIITGETTKTININTADLKTLKNHPLIDYKLAKSIYNYRKQHGRYYEWNDLTKLHLMKDHEDLEPYIKY